MSIGENIKRLRYSQGLTQKGLAEKTGLAEITIKQYESNKRNPKIETLRSIANVLGVSIAELIDNVQVPDSLSSNRKAIGYDLSKCTPIDPTGKQEELLIALSISNIRGILNFIENNLPSLKDLRGAEVIQPENLKTAKRSLNMIQNKAEKGITVNDRFVELSQGDKEIVNDLIDRLYIRKIRQNGIEEDNE